MDKSTGRICVLALCVLVLSACAQSATSTQAPSVPGSESIASLAITSSAFAHEAAIPTQYTCDGEDLSPPLEWSDPPPETGSLALIADDPDAPVGTWVHWVIYNVPADARGLPEAVPTDARLADESMQGKNSWPRTGYGGPCPPSGTHHYYFKLYALDTMLDLEPGATKSGLLKAMEGHILAEAQIMGTYARR